MKILLSAILINNVLLISFLGLENIINSTKKSMNAFGVICSSIILMIVASFANYVVYKNILRPLDVEILTLFVFSVNIVLMSYIIIWFLSKFANVFYTEIKDFIPIAATSSLILGVTILDIDKNVALSGYVYMNFCNALGFALIIILLTTIRDRLAIVKLPKYMEGAPIILITLGLISMAFMGFIGAGNYL